MEYFCGFDGCKKIIGLETQNTDIQFCTGVSWLQVRTNEDLKLYCEYSAIWLIGEHSTSFGAGVSLQRHLFPEVVRSVTPLIPLPTRSSSKEVGYEVLLKNCFEIADSRIDQFQSILETITEALSYEVLYCEVEQSLSCKEGPTPISSLPFAYSATRRQLPKQSIVNENMLSYRIYIYSV